MSADTKPGARATFPDGRVEVWTAGLGINLSGEALAEFARVCLKPTPRLVEVVEVPIEQVDPDVTTD